MQTLKPLAEIDQCDRLSTESAYDNSQAKYHFE